MTTVVVAGPLPVPGMQAGSAEIARGLDLGRLVDPGDGGPLGWSRYRPIAVRTFSMTSGLDDQPIGRLRDALRSIGRELEGPPHAADRGPWRWPSSKSICASDLCVASVGLSSRVVTITASTMPRNDPGSESDRRAGVAPTNPQPTGHALLVDYHTLDVRPPSQVCRRDQRTDCHPRGP